MFTSSQINGALQTLRYSRPCLWCGVGWEVKSDVSKVTVTVLSSKMYQAEKTVP